MVLQGHTFQIDMSLVTDPQEAYEGMFLSLDLIVLLTVANS